MENRCFEVLGGAFLFAVSLTKLHPGAGRAPGVVDLPVVRDPLGVWFVPGSQVKGSLKSLLGMRHSCLSNGKINCSIKDECKEICCLLGSDTDGSEGASALGSSDLYPLFVPAPADPQGLLYVTGRPLLSRAQALAETVGNKALASILGDLLKEASNRGGSLLVTESKESEDSSRGSTEASSDEKTLVLGARRIEYEKTYWKQDYKKLEEELGVLHSLYSSLPLPGRLLILEDRLLVPVLDSLLVRATRIRLDRKTKTVAHGGLWTEEYIPWGTAFSGLIIETGFTNNYCNREAEGGSSIERLKGLLRGNNQSGISLVVGGKETVGAGLIRISLISDEGGLNEG